MVRQQGTLIFLIGCEVFLGGSGRLLSMSIVGLPEPPALLLGYPFLGLLVSCIMIVAQAVTGFARKQLRRFSWVTPTRRRPHWISDHDARPRWPCPHAATPSTIR